MQEQFQTGRDQQQVVPTAPRTFVHVSSEPITRHAVDRLLADVTLDCEIQVIAGLAGLVDLVESGLRPDLALVAEATLSVTAGATIRRLRALHPELRVAIYGAPDSTTARDWLRIPVDGVIARSSEPEEFVSALRFILDGNRFISPRILLDESCATTPCAFATGHGRPLRLLDDLPGALFIVQGERIVYANEEAHAILGYLPGELLDRTLIDIFPEERRAEVQRLLTHGPEPDEIHAGAKVDMMRRKSGEPRWMESHHRRVYLAGTPALACLGFDVTESMGQRLTASAESPPRQEAFAGNDEVSVSGDLRWRNLTPRQIDVLRLLARGATNKEIAHRLAITEATVKLHVHHILRALGVNNRTEAALAARGLPIAD